MTTNINDLERSNQIEFVNNVQGGLEGLLSKLNLSNEATVGTQDFPKENENLSKIARMLFRYIADHQNKDDNPELRQYKTCGTHKTVGGVEGGRHHSL